MQTEEEKVCEAAIKKEILKYLNGKGSHYDLKIALIGLKQKSYISSKFDGKCSEQKLNEIIDFAIENIPFFHWIIDIEIIKPGTLKKLFENRNEKKSIFENKNEQVLINKYLVEWIQTKIKEPDDDFKDAKPLIDKFPTLKI